MCSVFIYRLFGNLSRIMSLFALGNHNWRGCVLAIRQQLCKNNIYSTITRFGCSCVVGRVVAKRRALASLPRLGRQIYGPDLFCQVFGLVFIKFANRSTKVLVQIVRVRRSVLPSVIVSLNYNFSALSGLILLLIV